MSVTVMNEFLFFNRFLFIPLMTIERSWAYAMQLKEESLQDNRKKFSMRNKLRKAAKYVAAFEKLVEVRVFCFKESVLFYHFGRHKTSFRNKVFLYHQYYFTQANLLLKSLQESGVCDARTQLEVQGYSAWLQGTVLFELADWSLEWDKPVEFFNKAL